MSADASLLFTNARVITIDPLQPRAEALAVAGNRIIFVGSKDEAESFLGPSTHRINAQGCTLLPGFIDGHYHLWIGSAEFDVADLNLVTSLQELTQVLRYHAQQHPQADWVTGSHLTYSLLPQGEHLTRHHLDQIFSDRPIALMAYDYHTVWVNTLGLEQAGLLQADRTGLDSGVVIGEDCLAEGELHEPSAYGCVLQLTGAWGRAASGLIDLPNAPQNPAQIAEDRALLRHGLELAARYGITSLHNMDGGYNQLAFFAGLEDAGELTCRIYVPLSISPDTSYQDLSEALAMRNDFRGRMVHGGFIKTFMDGVVESKTAFLLDEYVDNPGDFGSALYTPEQFNALAITADQLGLQICVHAIGDAAVRQTLNGYEAAQVKNGKRDSRHRIEHIELIHPDDLERFSKLGVLASMQPLHLPQDENHLWRQRTGLARGKYAFAWQSLRQAGARLVFGSDWPIVPPGPLPALKTALTRQPWQPGDPLQRQSLEDFLASFTHQAAYAGFEEQQLGQLKPGMLADLVLLNNNIEALPEEEYPAISPVMTVCDGRIVYQS